MSRRSLAFGICFLLVCSMIIPVSYGYNIKNTVEQQPSTLGNGNTLYVGGSGPGNYSKIQDAIDDASHGDTVFVYDDSSPYFELLVINKSIKLIGENRDTTVIDGNGSNDVINIISDGVTISCFTIQNSGYGEVPSINIKSNSIIIKENIIKSSNGDGIKLSGVNNILISNNTIMENYFQGILISNSNDIKIIHNDIYSSGNCGIYTAHVNNLFIFGNTFYHSFFLAWDTDLYDTECIIKRNTFNSLYGGIDLSCSKNCIVTENNFMNENCRVTFLYIYPSVPRNSNNSFDNNYWYKPRVIPKLIIGVIMPSSEFLLLIIFILRILPPCFHIDWHPARELFDIEV